MTIEINLIYLFYFLIVWFISGIVSFPLFYLSLYLDKKKSIFGYMQLIRTLVLGPVGLIVLIYEYIERLTNFIFGTKMWIVISKEGKIPFPYDDITSTIVSSYKLNHATDVIKSKKKLIYKSQFAETHPSYFKLTYKKERIKK